MQPFCYTQLLEGQINRDNVIGASQDREKVLANHLRLAP